MTTDLIPSADGHIVMKYGIHIRDSRRLLASQLKQVVNRAYSFLEYGSVLHQERVYLNEAVGLLNKELDGTLLVRKERIQASIYEFFDLMEELRTYADASTTNHSFHRERKLVKAIRKFVTKMNGQTNIRLNDAETEVLKAINLRGEVQVFFVNLRRIAPAFHSIFQGQRVTPVSTSEDLTDQQIRVRLLNHLSPELVAAYEETGNLLTEAKSVATNAEDEYFIEEVSKDYYHHIFQNLQKVAKETADFIQKEAVVNESLKQFKIIQLGLNKIIENSIANSMNAMKSQTDFLRNKIVGSRAFSLTPSELELEVETSVEQSQKLREELYKKHVAPRIEQNRLDFEAKLAAMQAEHQTEMAMMQERYEKQIKNLEEDTLSLRGYHAGEKKTFAAQGREYRNRIMALEAELAEKERFPANYPSPQFKGREERDWNITAGAIRVGPTKKETDAPQSGNSKLPHSHNDVYNPAKYLEAISECRSCRDYMYRR